jgi:hypothetical protein
MVFMHIMLKNGLSCIFDDVLRSADNKFYKDLILCNGGFYENELYYLVKKSNISDELIKRCLMASSSSFWHSLCVLTEADFKTQMSLEMIK